MLACAYSYAYTYGIFVKNTEHGTGGRKARHDSILVENYCPEKKQSTHSHKQKKILQNITTISIIFVQHQ